MLVELSGALMQLQFFALLAGATSVVGVFAIATAVGVQRRSGFDQHSAYRRRCPEPEVRNKRT